MLRSFFTKLKSGTEHLNYGREIIRDWGADLHGEALSRQTVPSGAFRILDLGCGHGTDLKNVRSEIDDRRPGSILPVELHGVESYPPYVADCRKAGIRTYALDIERDRYPGGEARFDVVIANQILEHTKELFWIFAEVARILKPGGVFLAGVPNLASLHNRLLLLFGQQPTPIQSMSAHVRGFTKPDMRRFAETGGFFRLERFGGSNFYPFPEGLARPLARLFPTLAWGSFYQLRRTERADGSFLDCLSGDDNFLETPYYGSPQNPAPSLKPAPRRAARPPTRRSAKKPSTKAKTRGAGDRKK